MAEKRHLQNVRSRVVKSNGQPKLPLSLLPGEIAINYHKGVETISLQNDSGDIVSFYDEVEISSGQPKVNTEIWVDLSDTTVTEIYTKQQIDTKVDAIDDDIASVSEKNSEQDNRLDSLEQKTAEMSGDTIAKIDEAIDALSGDIATKASQSDLEALESVVSGKADNSTFETFSAATEAEIDSLSALGISAIEVQVGNSASTISSNTKVFIDTDEDASVQIYTKEQMDVTVGSINNKDNEQDERITALEGTEAKVNVISGNVDTLTSNLTELSGIVANNIVISDGITPGSDTELYVDTSNDGGDFEIYTKAQVDTMIADLQRQIDALRP